MLTVASATVFAGNDDETARRAITGMVIDENGEPLAGASVLVVGTTIGAGTNANGEFSILLRDDCEQTLRISFMGYQPEEIQVNLRTRRNVTPRVQLYPAQNELNEVIVTGARVERPLKDTPILTRVISQKDIQALNPQSMETLLQYELPGLQIVYNSMSQVPEIKYQGMEGEYVLFLIDGERVSGEGADHNVDFTRFNIDDIERIEVIKGGAVGSLWFQCVGWSGEHHHEECQTPVHGKPECTLCREQRTEIYRFGRNQAEPFLFLVERHLPHA